MFTDRNKPYFWSSVTAPARRRRARAMIGLVLIAIALVVALCGEAASAESVNIEATYSIKDLIYVFFGALASVGALLFGSMRWLAARLVNLYDKNNEKRFDQLQNALAAIQEAQTRNADRINEVDRDVLRLRAELSEKFVRREDYVRTETAFHARLDRLNQIIQDLTTKLGQYANRP